MASSSSSSNVLRSLKSDDVSLVTFIGRTRRPVAVYWVDFNGHRVRYGVIGYGERFPLTTYETHPWIFRDRDTGDRLVTAAGQEIFWPKPWDGGNHDSVVIGIPVYTLREKCLQVVRSLVRTHEAIQDLSIPETLKDDLLKGSDNVSFSVHVDL